MAEVPVEKFKVIVIGGSAGSLEVILELVKKLPTHSGAVFIIVIHRKNDKDSILENLLSYRTQLTVKEVEDKEPILPNTIYLAPPDYHLLIEDEHNFSLDSSDKVNFSRPSIDVTFESVAEVFTNRVVGILLSGANADGAQGLLRIKELSGYTIVQSPESAEISFMPQQAIYLNAADSIMSTEELVETFNSLL